MEIKEDSVGNYIKRYINFVKRCISEGISEDHIPLVWHAYKLEETEDAIVYIDEAISGAIRYHR